MDQVTFGASEFADNPEPRCPCLLLLDTSASMEGEAMAELNRRLAAFRDELSTDALAMKRVELGIVSFGPVRVLADAGAVPAATGQRSTASGVDAELSRAFGGSLSSAPVNDRTDDDDTLVLASRRRA
jgi:uncharacterized protein YegL